MIFIKSTPISIATIILSTILSAHASSEYFRSHDVQDEVQLSHHNHYRANGVGGGGVQIDPNSSTLTSLGLDTVRCQPANTPLCNIQSYSTVQPFNNTLGHRELSEAIGELHKYTYLFARQPCQSYIQLFLCSLYVPVCVKSAILDGLLLPCRDDCEKARKYCINELQKVDNGTWPAEWNCNKFNYHEHDKLCVINNAKENPTTQPTTTAASTHSRSNDDSGTISEIDKSTDRLPGAGDQLPASPNGMNDQIHSSNETVCGEDLFDCRLQDPSRNMNALCIERRWVCDGKNDCVIDGDGYGGLDEANCEDKCRIGERYCDGKCISRSDICNGKVDCSSGIDEQDCYDYLTGLIQSILCIFAPLSAVYLLIRFLRFGDQKSPDTKITSEEPYTREHYYSANKNLNTHNENHKHSLFLTDDAASQPPLDENMISHHLAHNPSLRPLDEDILSQHLAHTQRCPIYHELTYSIATRSDYERLNVGGYSGASSVYGASYGAYHPPSMLYEHKEPPAAPPPTPALSQIYSTGSITKLADLYVNMNNHPHMTDLLD